MKLEQLKELAKAGKLHLYKYERGTYKRRKYIYSNEEDILDQKLIRMEETPYKKYQYQCRTNDMPEHSYFKITSKDYKILLKESEVLNK